MQGSRGGKIWSRPPSYQRRYTEYTSKSPSIQSHPRWSNDDWRNQYCNPLMSWVGHGQHSTFIQQRAGGSEISTQYRDTRGSQIFQSSGQLQHSGFIDTIDTGYSRPNLCAKDFFFETSASSFNSNSSGNNCETSQNPNYI